MNLEEIQEAAKEVIGLDGIDEENKIIGPFLYSELNRFAAIIEKRTIERCAVVCETLRDLQMYADKQEAQNDCAAAIRKLGEQ